MPNARRLLVVDDDQDLRDTLTEQLALYDEFEILSADTAASAINQAKADRIDLAIVDGTVGHAAAPPRSPMNSRRKRQTPQASSPGTRHPEPQRTPNPKSPCS